jgi:hypothetical protein
MTAYSPFSGQNMVVERVVLELFNTTHSTEWCAGELNQPTEKSLPTVVRERKFTARLARINVRAPSITEHYIEY